MNGTFYGVGVGPGDPELLTVKAQRLISTAKVVAYPVDGGQKSLARSIVEGLLATEIVHLPVQIPIHISGETARCAYEAGAKDISLHLLQGTDVIFICEGDPFFFGSYMYLHELLAGRFSCKTVPGIASPMACAAELGRPLAARNDVLKIIPAPLEEARLICELETCQSAAIIKVGRHFDKVRRVLRACGLAHSAWVIEAATSARQKITELEDTPEGARPYFSTILIRRGDKPL